MRLYYKTSLTLVASWPPERKVEMCQNFSAVCCLLSAVCCLLYVSVSRPLALTGSNQMGAGGPGVTETFPLEEDRIWGPCNELWNCIAGWYSIVRGKDHCLLGRHRGHCALVK